MNEEINEVENFTAKDFRKMVKGGDEVQNNIIMNKCNLIGKNLLILLVFII